jgi:hypothetical protein
MREVEANDRLGLWRESVKDRLAGFPVVLLTRDMLAEGLIVVVPFVKMMSIPEIEASGVLTS